MKTNDSNNNSLIGFAARQHEIFPLLFPYLRIDALLFFFFSSFSFNKQTTTRSWYHQFYVGIFFKNKNKTYLVSIQNQSILHRFDKMEVIFRNENKQQPKVNFIRIASECARSTVKGSSIKLLTVDDALGQNFYFAPNHHVI